MLDLDTIRKEFAEFLLNEPSARWRMDAALAHVVTLAYEKGLEDGKKPEQIPTLTIPQPKPEKRRP